MSELLKRIRTIEDAFYFIASLNPCYQQNNETICVFCGATTGMAQICEPIHKPDCLISEAERALRALGDGAEVRTERIEQLEQALRGILAITGDFHNKDWWLTKTVSAEVSKIEQITHEALGPAEDGTADDKQPILRVLDWIGAAGMPKVTDHYVAGPDTLYVTFRFKPTPQQLDQMRALNLEVHRTRIERRFMLTFVPSPDDEE